MYLFDIRNLGLFGKKRMGLSKYLQSEEIMKEVPGRSPDDLRSYILETGLAWCAKHPDERKIVTANLEKLNLPVSDKLVEDIQKHIVLHYYEKILPFGLGPEGYCDFLKTRISIDNELAKLRACINDGKGALIALAHFGAVEFIAPRLIASKLPVSPALRFTTGRFSRIFQEFGKELTRRGLAGDINFIEIGKPGTTAALDMAAALRRKEILVTVFDEKTDYSTPVTLFGTRVWGGAGLDKLITFVRSPIAVFNAFIIRTGINTFTFKLSAVPLEATDPIQSMFSNLEGVVRDHMNQWYFLHEQIPFVENNTQE